VEVGLKIKPRFKQFAVAVAIATGSMAAHAQVVLVQGFDDVAALAASGWSFLNTSTSPGTNWFQGNSGIFDAASGAPDSYAAANFLGTTGATGSVSNWMITPQLLLDSTSTVSFLARTAGSGLLDTVQVMVSTSGIAPANFTMVGSYSSSAATGWTPVNFSLGLLSQTPAFVAFRYVVADVSVNGNYLGIDDVVITAVPEPATLLLLGLGIAGLLARRRFNA